MSLEQIIAQTTNFVTSEPVHALLDIGGHCLAGAFLVQRYFPEVPKLKKMMLGFFGGLSPDFDFFTCGLIPHRTVTHTMYYAGLLAGNVYVFNKEDRKKRLKGHKLLEFIGRDIKRFCSSRYVKLTSLGIAMHLGMDSLYSNLERVEYCAIIGSALFLQALVNQKQKRYEPVQEEFQIRPCVIRNKEGRRYFVCEEATQKVEADCSFKELPEYPIENYTFGDFKKVREFQQKLFSCEKDVYKKIEDRLKNGFESYSTMGKSIALPF